ncbi:membrane-associated protein, putative, partial [Bodo saltans]
MCTALYYLLVFGVAAVVAAETDRTALNCTTDTYVNVAALISTAGQYDVSCTGFSEWSVWIVGCASNGTNNSSNSVVSIRLLNSPTQVHVTDNATLLPPTVNATLAGCSVDITYLSDTVVPSDATLPHVLVSSTSFMGNISVVLLAALYLERNFIAILGNNSGGIESVALRCDQGSSIVCRRADNTSYSICSPLQGTSVILLAPGCPQIGALSVHLDGTNVTGSMWLKTDFTSTSSFSFILIDNLTQTSVTPSPRANTIIAKDVQGPLVLSTVLNLRNPFSSFNAYDIRQCNLIAINCTMTADTWLGATTIFSLSNVVTLRIMLIGVLVTGNFLFAAISSDAISEGAALWPVRIRIVNSSLHSTTQFLAFSAPNPSPISKNVLSMSAVDSTFVLDGFAAELLKFYSNSASSSVPPLLMTVSILFSQCTINTTVNSIPLLYTLSPNQAQPLPILHNSSIVFEDSVVCQMWETYVNYFGTVFPPVPLIQADLNATTIVFARCNIFVQQVSTPIDPAVALLLSVTNAMTTSSLHFINSSITVAANITSPLRTFPISVNAMSSSNITLTNTTLTNIVALVQLLNTSSPHDPPFSALADNPLSISLPIGATSDGGTSSLDYAAGAALGNLLVVIVSAAMLHCVHLLQKRLRRHARGDAVPQPSGKALHSFAAAALSSSASKKVTPGEAMPSSPTRKTLCSVPTSVIALLPASPLPGSVRLVYVVLLQPGIGACIALMVSPERNISSVICGALLMMIWLLFPFYCGHKILIQGRSQAQPVHRSAPSESAFLLRSVKMRDVPRSSASH